MLAAAMFLRKVEMVALGLIKKKYIYIYGCPNSHWNLDHHYRIRSLDHNLEWMAHKSMLQHQFLTSKTIELRFIHTVSNLPWCISGK